MDEPGGTVVHGTYSKEPPTRCQRSAQALKRGIHSWLRDWNHAPSVHMDQDYRRVSDSSH
ncbi:hypothetical protein SLNHY_3044 [Streptomyces albus]|nr:hypothetical protein SLNHY_3044 [Streptomyces albus]